MTPAETVVQVTEKLVVVFDLDDTLYREIDFVRSGFRAVADAIQSSAGLDLYSELMLLVERGEGDTFDLIRQRHGFLSPSSEELVKIYREHEPTLHLPSSSAITLTRIAEREIPLGLLTDGRSVTQRNKLRALGIADCFAEIVVSEEIGSLKPDRQNYQHFEDAFPNGEFVYIGDNPRKDFVTPNSMGWSTIGLRDCGKNIHSQDVTLPSEFFPQYSVESLDQIRFV